MIRLSTLFGFRTSVKRLVNAEFARNNSSLASGKLLRSERNGLLCLTYSNERLKNATDFEVYNTVSEQLRMASTDDSVKAVMFRGKGDFYSSGIDLSSFLPYFSSANKETLLKQSRSSIEGYVSAFIDFPKPIIAAVNGPAYGIAVTTLALKDIVVCADTAVFQTPFSIHGFTAEGCSSVTFPQIFGFATANQLLMLSEIINASQALHYGLVSKVFPVAKFDNEVEKLIFGDNGMLTSHSLETIMTTKALTKNEEFKQKLRAANKAECDTLEKLWTSPDFEARVQTFFEKKKQKQKM
ncbi:enoyl-CoA delta isomerase 2-like protein [Leptotrombidium deliense]|uniref:Enoyl-CoA delta isomerase 2-like protein n=1 Tax=Leptotrombidium deliense TaxID=299467 RepID=A0A443S4W9_9ACAR|nr:enoyl-CoA delta isomerase 2-like protein [Leptotrombidium deliense]